MRRKMRASRQSVVTGDAGDPVLRRRAAGDAGRTPGNAVVPNRTPRTLVPNSSKRSTPCGGSGVTARVAPEPRGARARARGARRAEEQQTKLSPSCARARQRQTTHADALLPRASSRDLPADPRAIPTVTDGVVQVLQKSTGRRKLDAVELARRAGPTPSATVAAATPATAAVFGRLYESGEVVITVRIPVRFDHTSVRTRSSRPTISSRAAAGSS